MSLTLGSLFDGIGVFPLAASRHGIIPVWASEIEKVPISITKRHFPDMLHLGDITKLKGSEIPPVHIITFGSPCQNLSTIGFREGLAGSKSGLFYHAIRIIKEMRCATNGIFPVITVWENVAGAFSSNHRLDFKFVLESFTDSEIPMPDSGRWAKCGMVRGSVADVCWRLLDAQYWGEPEESASLSWQILEDSVPQKYYLNPVNCTHFLTLAQRAGYPPPEPVEYLLLKQGGKYLSYVPLRKDECEAVQNREIYPDSYEASDGQMTLFPLF